MHINPINLGGASAEAVSGMGTTPATAKVSEGSFGSIIQKFVADTNAQQVQADQSVQRLASGQSDSIHETMLAMAKADLSLRLFVEVQSKVVEAYQEVMRMQM
jgi:flagellar hook-basal body complex protein FliE